MFYLFLFIIVSLILSILVISKNYYSSKVVFEKRIDVLENIIGDLQIKLRNKNENVKIADNLKHNLDLSNKILSAKILDMNQLMFEDLFKKKLI
jgi:ribulose 1,5-bisphosphate synthetase/thiazole synthase